MLIFLSSSNFLRFFVVGGVASAIAGVIDGGEVGRDAAVEQLMGEGALVMGFDGEATIGAGIKGR